MFNHPSIMQAVALEQQQDRLREAEHRRLYSQARKTRSVWIQKIATFLWTNAGRWHMHAQSKPIFPLISGR